MGKKPLKFEQALAKLEKIADEIERGEIGLEDAITRYEEGMKLVQRCREILSEAEQRIVKLQPQSPPEAGESAQEPPTQRRNKSS